jgi:hypothetical protein
MSPASERGLFFLQIGINEIGQNRHLKSFVSSGCGKFFEIIGDDFTAKGTKNGHELRKSRTTHPSNGG